MSKENADKEQKRSFKREVFSWIACIVVTILLTEFILNFVIINANIPSGSMENTIMTNDKLIALRTSYWFNDPKRGDIIIFKYPVGAFVSTVNPGSLISVDPNGVLYLT